MTIVTSRYGEVAGQQVDSFTLTNKSGSEVTVISYGAIITSLKVKNRVGELQDVVLGYDSLERYVDNNPYFGCVVGRYANRIADGKFMLDGQEFSLQQNDGPNSLHGGLKGFDKVVWSVEQVADDRGPAIRLSYTSPDGEEGYPGELVARVVYVLTDKDELLIEYEAETDKETIACLTQHSYFNLSGEDTILEHEVLLKASNYTPVNEVYIPTGQICTVAGTGLDFTEPTRIGEAIERAEPDQLLNGGFDHNFVLDDPSAKVSLAAVLVSRESGIKMKMFTTEPGVQFYTGNFLDESMVGKNDKQYNKFAGVCLEAQHFPDSPNQPDFPSVILAPGEKYRQTTMYAFGRVD